jgi:hypothetical protein
VDPVEPDPPDGRPVEPLEPDPMEGIPDEPDPPMDDMSGISGRGSMQTRS